MKAPIIKRESTCPHNLISHYTAALKMCLCFILLCTAVLYEYVVTIMLKKYIKTLHSSSDFFNASFLSPHFRFCIMVPRIAWCCRLRFLKHNWRAWPTKLPSPTRQAQFREHSFSMPTHHFLVHSNRLHVKTTNLYQDNQKLSVAAQLQAFLSHSPNIMILSYRDTAKSLAHV